MCLPRVVIEYLQSLSVQQYATPGKQAVSRQLVWGCTIQGTTVHREVHHCLLQVYHAAILRNATDQGPEKGRKHWLWDPGSTRHMPQKYLQVFWDQREWVLVGT